jgi:hypothetical protein
MMALPRRPTRPSMLMPLAGVSPSKAASPDDARRFGLLGRALTPLSPEATLSGLLGRALMPLSPEATRIGLLGRALIPLSPEATRIGLLGRSQAPRFIDAWFSDP